MNPVVLFVALLAGRPYRLPGRIFLAEIQRMLYDRVVFALMRDHVHRFLNNGPDMVLRESEGGEQGVEDPAQHAIVGVGDDRIVRGKSRSELRVSGC